MERSADKWGDAELERIKQGQQTIKNHMPEVYALIREAAQVHGDGVWRTVRRGLAGVAGQFWAVERGLIVGTPFAGQPAWHTVGMTTVDSACVCIMAPLAAISPEPGG